MAFRPIIIRYSMYDILHMVCTTPINIYCSLYQQPNPQVLNRSRSGLAYSAALWRAITIPRSTILVRIHACHLKLFMLSAICSRDETTFGGQSNCRPSTECFSSVIMSMFLNDNNSKGDDGWKVPKFKFISKLIGVDLWILDANNWISQLAKSFFTGVHILYNTWILFFEIVRSLIANIQNRFINCCCDGSTSTLV